MFVILGHDSHNFIFIMVIHVCLFCDLLADKYSVRIENSTRHQLKHKYNMSNIFNLVPLSRFTLRCVGLFLIISPYFWQFKAGLAHFRFFFSRGSYIIMPFFLIDITAP